ncbi:hypothetical protein J6590_089505, partial [Homalodisca vitripennis]
LTLEIHFTTIGEGKVVAREPTSVQGQRSSLNLTGFTKCNGAKEVFEISITLIFTARRARDPPHTEIHIHNSFQSPIICHALGSAKHVKEV